MTFYEITCKERNGGFLHSVLYFLVLLLILRVIKSLIKYRNYFNLKKKLFIIEILFYGIYMRTTIFRNSTNVICQIVVLSHQLHKKFHLLD